MSELEETFAVLWRTLAPDQPAPEREYRFAAVLVGTGPGMRGRLDGAGWRDWRFDFAWLDQRVAVECDGGVWTRGRHVRGRGYEGDCLKGNAATLLGWRVFHCTASMLRDDPAAFVAQVRDAIEGG